MYDAALNEEKLKHLEHLPPELQRQVLELSRAMAKSATRGIPGKQLLRFSGIIGQKDTNTMAHLVEEGCERVDPNEW